MSEAYTSFAAVYDTFMDETPYAEWCEYLAELLNEYGMIQLPEDENLRTEANCILDLGCGTGVLTEMLAAFAAYCDRHELRYYLVGGTLLGAVRHQGFIPLDDDVDVGFLYDDWKKLKSVISDELQNGFSYIDNDIDSSYPRLFGKVLYDKKPCVDLFLLAKWTNKKWSGLLHWRIRIFAVEGFKFTLKKNKKACRPGDSKMVCIKNKMHFFIQSCIFFVLSPFVSTKWYVDIARKNEVYFEGLENDYG